MLQIMCAEQRGSLYELLSLHVYSKNRPVVKVGSDRSDDPQFGQVLFLRSKFLSVSDYSFNSVVAVSYTHLTLPTKRIV